MAKVDYVKINNTIKYIQNVAYLPALPTANEDSADFVSVNNELYVKQVNGTTYTYAKVGGSGGGLTVLNKTLDGEFEIGAENLRFTEDFSLEEFDLLYNFQAIIRFDIDIGRGISSLYLIPTESANVEGNATVTCVLNYGGMMNVVVSLILMEGELTYQISTIPIESGGSGGATIIEKETTSNAETGMPNFDTLTFTSEELTKMQEDNVILKIVVPDESSAMFLNKTQNYGTAPYLYYAFITVVGGQEIMLMVVDNNGSSMVMPTITQLGGGAPISIVNELPEANEENFEKGKIYTTGELLQYISKVALSEPNIQDVSALSQSAEVIGSVYHNKKIYSCFGYYKSIDIFDTETNQTTTLTNILPYICSYSQKINMEVYNNKIYIFGEGSATQETYLRGIYEFDINTHELVQKQTYIYGLSGSTTSRVGTKIYIFGGTASSGQFNTVKVYDIENNNVTTASATFPNARYGMASITKGTDIYIFGGQTGASSMLNTIFKYNTVSGLLENTGVVLPQNLGRPNLGVIGDNIYIFGGNKSSNTYSNAIYRYNISNNTIETMSYTLSTNRANAGNVSLTDTVYLLGGKTGQYNNTSNITKLEFGYTFQYKTISTKDDLGGSGNGIAFIDITGLDVLPSEYQNEETLKTAILFDTDHLLRLTWIDDMYYFGNTDDFQYRYLSIDTSDWVIMRYDLQEIAKAPKVVNLNTYVPSTATNGTLDSSVLATLQASDSNYIVFNNEIFKLADKQHNEGYLVYSHNGHDTTGCFFQKCITITISTRGWVLEEQENQAKLTAGSGITIENNVISSTGGGGTTTDTAYVSNSTLYIEEGTTAGGGASGLKVVEITELTGEQINDDTQPTQITLTKERYEEIYNADVLKIGDASSFLLLYKHLDAPPFTDTNISSSGAHFSFMTLAKGSADSIYFNNYSIMVVFAKTSFAENYSLTYEFIKLQY